MQTFFMNGLRSPCCFQCLVSLCTNEPKVMVSFIPWNLKMVKIIQMLGKVLFFFMFEGKAGKSFFVAGAGDVEGVLVSSASFYS